MILYHNTVEGVLSSCAGSDWPGLTWHVSPVQQGSAFPWQQDSLLEDMSLTDDAAVFVAVKLLAVNTPCCSIIEEKPLTKSHNKLLTLKVPRCLIIEKPLRTVTKHNSWRCWKQTWWNSEIQQVSERRNREAGKLLNWTQRDIFSQVSWTGMS